MLEASVGDPIRPSQGEDMYVASIIGSIVRNPIVQDAAREAFKVALRAIMKKLG